MSALRPRHISFQVYNQNFSVRAGVVEGDGGNSERCLKWGDGGGGGH